MKYLGSAGQHPDGGSVYPIPVGDRRAVVCRYKKDSVGEFQKGEEDQFVVHEELWIKEMECKSKWYTGSIRIDKVVGFGLTLF